MQVPWVKCSLFVYFLFIAVLNHDAQAITCSLIKVPNVDVDFRQNGNVDVYWINSLPMATYTATGCCKNKNPSSGQHCSECPQVKNVNNCKDDTESGKKACEPFFHFLPPDLTIVVNLTIHVPGCPDKSKVTSLNTTFKVIKLKPVEGLSLKFKPEGLTLDASWSYGGTDFPSHPKLPCDFYEINEILESGKKRLIERKNITEQSVTYSLPKNINYAYNLFRICVKLQYCTDQFRGLMSDERCVDARSPPKAPSKPLIMLCGTENKKDCNITKDATKRNITLVWKLPEKSSWNGLAEKIMIRINIKSRLRNGTYEINISDVNTTHYTLTLNRDAEYHIELVFYSNGGEGPSSKIVMLNKDVKEKPINPFKKEAELDKTLLIIIVAACIVLVIAVIVAFVCLLQKSRRKHKLNSMPRLQVPWQERMHSGTDPNLRSNPATYDVIDSEEPEICSNIPAGKTSFEKLSCNGSSTSESTNDSITCPLVTNTIKNTRDADVKYPEKTGRDESASFLMSSEHTSDV